MKILNLYAGLGGNRFLWGEEHEVTAVEKDSAIAEGYTELHPADKVVVGDAKEFLRKHFSEFDFIWASPVCITHSRLQRNSKMPVPPHFVDMSLWEIILFLKQYVKCPWVVENVVPWYKPFIEPTAKIGRHLFWCSDFLFSIDECLNKSFDSMSTRDLAKAYGIPRVRVKGKDIRTLYRNMVNPQIGAYLLDALTKWR